MPDPISADTWSQAIQAFYFSYRAFTAKPDEILARRGLSRVHHRILFFVARQPQLSVKELLATRVRPAVAQDGGDITFKGYRDGRVYLNMKGACSGCPSSTATLKHGVQKLLHHFVPEVQEVEAVM